MTPSFVDPSTPLLRPSAMIPAGYKSKVVQAAFALYCVGTYLTFVLSSWHYFDAVRKGQPAGYQFLRTLLGSFLNFCLCNVLIVVLFVWWRVDKRRPAVVAGSATA
jgi:hypothetical protein